jgi:integrase
MPCDTAVSAPEGIVICALDTGLRQGEIFSLRWKDVDLANGLLNIHAFHTKTMKERQVAITTRLAIELERLKASAPNDPNGLVFGILDNVKRSFMAARSQVGLNDLRFHDLRHTAATRLVAAHIPLSEVGRVLGHTQANTTYRYVNANVERQNGPRRLWMPSIPKHRRPQLRQNWCTEGEAVLNF